MCVCMSVYRRAECRINNNRMVMCWQYDILYKERSFNSNMLGKHFFGQQRMVYNMVQGYNERLHLVSQSSLNHKDQ